MVAKLASSNVVESVVLVLMSLAFCNSLILNQYNNVSNCTGDLKITNQVIFEIGKCGPNGELLISCNDNQAIVLYTSCDMYRSGKRTCPPTMDYHVSEMKTYSLNKCYSISNSVSSVSNGSFVFSCAANAAVKLPNSVLSLQGKPAYAYKTYTMNCDSKNHYMSRLNPRVPSQCSKPGYISPDKCTPNLTGYAWSDSCSQYPQNFSLGMGATIVPKAYN